MRRRSAILVSITALTGVVALFGASCVSTRGPTVPVGAEAPSFSLRSHLGGDVTLEQLTAAGPAVLIFYRGHW
ncbi:MAG: hypothetical protein U0271_23895 [Polyangiaceae bacterium]